MTLKEAYIYYYAYCRDIETWTWDFIQDNLKKNWIDYEQFTREEFKNKLLTNDKFNERWGQGCTRTLSTQERKDLYNETDYSKDIFPTDENGWNKLFDSYNIPTRTIISEI